MQRRKFLATVGSLAAGSAAAMGTGAFTTASADRSVTVDVNGDQNSMIGLVPNEDLSDISVNNDGELELDLSGENGEGVNINSHYRWGEHNDRYGDGQFNGDPTESFAFALVNNDEQNYAGLDFTFTLNNASWLEDNWESFIKFTVYRDGWSPKEKRFPDPYEPEKVTTQDMASGMIFDSGETWYVVVDVDTTVGHADIADDLSGTLEISVSEPTTQSD